MMCKQFTQTSDKLFTSFVNRSTNPHRAFFFFEPLLMRSIHAKAIALILVGYVNWKISEANKTVCQFFFPKNRLVNKMMATNIGLPYEPKCPPYRAFSFDAQIRW